MQNAERDIGWIPTPQPQLSQACAERSKTANFYTESWKYSDILLNNDRIQLLNITTSLFKGFDLRHDLYGVNSSILNLALEMWLDQTRVSYEAQFNPVNIKLSGTPLSPLYAGTSNLRTKHRASRLWVSDEPCSSPGRF
jgi:hypothetical protein